MIDKEIVFVTGDDWIAMYVNGEKVIDGHSLPYRSILEALGIPFTTQEAPRVDPNLGEVVYGDTLGDIAIWYYGKE